MKGTKLQAKCDIFDGLVEPNLIIGRGSIFPIWCVIIGDNHKGILYLEITSESGFSLRLDYNFFCLFDEVEE